MAKDYESQPWLHIRSQFTYHAEANIRGTKVGLRCLRDALDDAIGTGKGETSATASDGEGYGIIIQRVNSVASLGRPTYLDEEARHLAYSEREYLIRESKTNRAVTKEAYEALRWCRANGDPHTPSAATPA